MNIYDVNIYDTNIFDRKDIINEFVMYKLPNYYMNVNITYSMLWYSTREVQIQKQTNSRKSVSVNIT